MAVEQKHIDELAAAKAGMLALEERVKAIDEQGVALSQQLCGAKRRYREALEAVGEAA